MNKKKLVIIAGAAVCLGAAWYATRPAPTPAAGKNAGQQSTVVNVVRPQRRDVPVLLQANGTVTPLSSVELHPQITSTIEHVHISEGQFVKAGQRMFSLDGRSARAAVERAQAQLQRDQAALADVERQYRRGLELLSQRFIAQGAVDTLKSQLDAARALVAADSAALRTAQVEAGYVTIRAPMAGRVGAIGVYPGSLVQLGTALTSVTRLDPISIAFALPEANLAALLAAQKAGAVPVKAMLAEGREAAGQLSFVDNTVDPVAGVIRVKARFDNRDGQLWPGQYVNVRLTVQTLKAALVIPQNAIISNTSGIFVYVMAADQSAQVRKVARLYGFGDLAAVSGLDGNEQVIVEGKQNLRPGARVKLAGAPRKEAKAQ